MCTVCERSCGELCMENIFFIGRTTARQVINIVPAGFKPTIYICQGSALATRIMPVPDLLVPRTIYKLRGENCSKWQQ